MNILLAWIGLTDLRAANNEAEAGPGPIGQVVQTRIYDKILLLSNLERGQAENYQNWIQKKTKTNLEIIEAKLSGPTEFGEIYTKVRETILKIKTEFPDAKLTFHLSPGTPAMAAVWIILAKTRFPAELIESSKQSGVRTVSVPFEITAEFIPDIIRQSEEHLEKVSLKLSSAAEFKDIVYQSTQMQEVVETAQIVALHNVSVLIEGETGTGKELFAKSIHRSGPRKNNPFIVVNCGAIPSELVESELFGHKKGSFTGAIKDYDGAFKSAHGGTIFLDEIGELSLPAQIRLLRVVQEKEITAVGETKPHKIDVRIISATNRNLLEEVSAGRFREDLFYRLAVFPLFLPPLRERKGDLELLIDYFLSKLNQENTGKLWKTDKFFTPEAAKLLLSHNWNGNVRELQNTILRVCIQCREELIEQKVVESSLFVVKSKEQKSLFNYPLVSGFSLPNLINEISKHYLNSALEESRGNKTKAAQMVGLANYQTFDNWLKRLNITSNPDSEIEN
jgi:transcriptional regulator with GAF, ATPase, and Fis domain